MIVKRYGICRNLCYRKKSNIAQIPHHRLRQTQGGQGRSDGISTGSCYQRLSSETRNEQAERDQGTGTVTNQGTVT